MRRRAVADWTTSNPSDLLEMGRPALLQPPVGLFGSVMGVTGLSVAWGLAHVRYGAPIGIALGLGALAVIAFALLVAAYGIRLVTDFDAVREEFHHPASSSLFGTIPTSLLQLPIVLDPFAHRLAQIVWISGVVGMLLFIWILISRWIANAQPVTYATPAWIIPIAGVLNVPLAVPALGFMRLHVLMVATQSIGFFLTIPIFTLVLSRLLSGPPLPAETKPSLLILVTPFAVGYSTYAVTAARADLFAESLFTLTLFLLVILIAQLRYLTACCPFRVAWWSVSFPLAACSTAATRFAAAWPGPVSDMIALAVLTLATLIVVRLLVGTLSNA